MRLLSNTLLTGPYDWDDAVLPRAEFEARLARVREAMTKAGARALLVHAHAGDFGAIAYLTSFVPKLDRALALVPCEGAIRLLVAGSDLMIPQAKLLTWVEDVRPLANVPRLVADWLGEESGPVATWGFAALPQGMYRGIVGALSGRTLLPLDVALNAVRRKSPRELDLMRGAARILGTAADAFRASVRSGSGARSAAMAAERAAIAAGAQDARTLVSLSPGGAPLPVEGPEDRTLDPLLAGVGVQHAGYWATGYLTIARAPGAALARAKDALAAALASARPGTTPAILAAVANAKLAPLLPHPATARQLVTAVGLSLDEGPVVTLETGATYVIAVGAQGEGSDAAIVSALVALNMSGNEILWS